MRAEKEIFLQEIRDKIDNSDGMIVSSYDKLTPIISWNFMKGLSSSNSYFEVIKKRVFLKAAEKSGIIFDLDGFDGHLGVVFVKGDVLAATKTLLKFSKENEGINIKILLARFDNKIHSSEDVTMLSELPSLPEMRSIMLSLFEGPMVSVVSSIEAVLSGVLYCLENKNQKS